MWEAFTGHLAPALLPPVGAGRMSLRSEYALVYVCARLGEVPGRAEELRKSKCPPYRRRADILGLVDPRGGLACNMGRAQVTLEPSGRRAGAALCWAATIVITDCPLKLLEVPKEVLQFLDHEHSQTLSIRR